MDWKQQLQQMISESQARFAGLLAEHLPDGRLDLDRYCRYLTMQYHLTKGVHRYFYGVAAHSSLARRKRFRAFLVRFAHEEELHYLVAGSDLAKLGRDVGPVPFDVQLWHAWFGQTVASRPFVRLGAAVILENLSGGAARDSVRAALSAPFLTRENTKFVTIHQHEGLPHGDQLIEAIADALPTPAEARELLQGAKIGMVLYLRMAEWSLDMDSLSAIADEFDSESDDGERERIQAFTLDDLHDAG